MKGRWQQLAACFDALAQRERLMVGGGLLFAIAFLGYTLLVEPQLLRQANADKRAAEASAELPVIAASLAQLQAQLKDPDQAKRASLQEARKGITAADARLRALSGNMLPPSMMPVFLESLLARNPKLELLSLRTLPPSFLIERAEEKKETKETKGNGPEVGGIPNIYKHGVEIRIAGSYGELLAYLEELERMPQRILWSKLTLTAEQYPRSVLTLTVYTLSLDKQWLVV